RRIFGATGQVDTTPFISLSNVADCYSMVVGAGGQILLSTTAGTVRRFTSLGVAEPDISDDFVNARRMAVDSVGNLYVIDEIDPGAQSNTWRVYKVTGY